MEHVHAPAIPLEDYEKLKQENKHLQQQLNAAKGRETLARKRNPALNATSTESKITDSVLPGESNEKKTEQKEGHYIDSFRKYCPFCEGEAETARNPDFKDEVICKDCGQHLGAQANIWHPEKNPKGKMRRCPSCGSTHATRI